jgi:hypothetical protein
MATDIGRNARRIAVGATLAGGAIFGFASSTAQLGDDVAKTADKLGIGIEKLQELRYAAERSGVATTAFDTALEKMTKNIGLALEGTGAQKDALDALGLSAANLATMSPEEALGVIADRLQAVETQAEKAAIANDLFGRSGIGMLNMLRDGSAGLVRLREDARRTGYVLSEQAARDAEVFQDTLLDTQLVMKGLKNTVGVALMPVVTQAMRRVGDTLVENREDVQRWAEGFADGVERALHPIGKVVTGLGKIGGIVWDVVEGTAKMVGGWENFGMVIGAVLATRTIARVAKFGAAVFSLGKALFTLAGTTPLVVGGIRAIGAAMLMNPIGLAVAGITGAAYLIYRNWQYVGPWFQGLWGDVKTFFQGFGDFVTGVFAGYMDYAATGIQTIWKGTKTILGSVLGGIGGIFRWSYDNLIKPVTDALGITAPIETAWRGVNTLLGPIMGDIGGHFTGMGDVIDGVITGDMQQAADGAERMWKSARSTLGRILGGIGGIFSWSYNNLIKPITDKFGITDTIEQAWSGLQTSIETIVHGIGRVFNTAWTTTLKPVIDGLAATGGISNSWEALKAALDPILTWIGDKFQAIMTFIQPVIDALKWVQDKGTVAVSHIGNALGLTSDEPTTDGTGASGYGRPQANALGGPFRPGWHLTGELGPELKFENRSGYVANNRALRQLAGYADRAGSLMDRHRAVPRRAGAVMDRAARVMASRNRATQPRSALDAGIAARVEALFASGGTGAQPAAAAAGPVTQHITYTIHAAGASAEEVIRLVERKSRQAAGNGLFDRAPSTGPYGR